PVAQGKPCLPLAWKLRRRPNHCPSPEPIRATWLQVDAPYAHEDAKRRRTGSRLAQLAQKHEHREGELQPTPVPDDVAGEPEVPSQAEHEKHQSDHGSDPPGSQQVLPESPLLRRAALDGVLHDSASCHGADRSEVPESESTRWASYLSDARVSVNPAVEYVS